MATRASPQRAPSGQSLIANPLFKGFLSVSMENLGAKVKIEATQQRLPTAR
jgi:hypothetical protein